MVVRTIAIIILSNSFVAAAGRVEPDALEYLGAFRLPRRSGNAPRRWGYGARALTYNPTRDSLIGSGHVHRRNVAESSIVEPNIPTTRDKMLALRELRQAETITPFAAIAGPLDARLAALRLDRFGGLALLDGRLFWSFYRYYAVQPPSTIDDPTLGSSALDFTGPRGLWRAGPFHQKRTSNYLAAIPEEWAESHVGGKRLAAGKGDGAGSAGVSHGPALFAVDHRANPPDGGALEAVKLLEYPPAGDHFPGWSPCDRWEGLAWVEAGERSAVVFAGRRGRGVADYGKPGEVTARQNRRTCGTAKGYHCDPYDPELVFYDPAELARVAAGELEPFDVLPYASLSLAPVFLETCLYDLGAMAYDPSSRRLFLVQQNGENGVVHLWKIEAAASPVPVPVPVLELVVVVVDGEAREFTSGTKFGAMAKAASFLVAKLAEGIE